MGGIKTAEKVTQMLGFCYGETQMDGIQPDQYQYLSCSSKTMRRQLGKRERGARERNRSTVHSQRSLKAPMLECPPKWRRDFSRLGALLDQRPSAKMIEDRWWRSFCTELGPTSCLSCHPPQHQGNYVQGRGDLQWADTTHIWTIMNSWPVQYWNLIIIIIIKAFTKHKPLVTETILSAHTRTHIHRQTHIHTGRHPPTQV